MGKKRKTRKEKTVAAGRHNFQNLLTVPATPDIQSLIDVTKPISPEPYESHESINKHLYVARDVRSTLIITLLLVLINFVVFFILKLKVVNFPGIGF